MLTNVLGKKNHNMNSGSLANPENEGKQWSLAETFVSKYTVISFQVWSFWEKQRKKSTANIFLDIYDRYEIMNEIKRCFMKISMFKELSVFLKMLLDALIF